MHISKAALADQITKPLSQLFGQDIPRAKVAYQEGSSPGTVLRVSVFEKGLQAHRYILKRQENDVAYRLYKQFLEPHHLNSPKEYGYVEIEAQRFLVMDYIEHLPIHWSDPNGYLKAVKWLIKKDLVASQNWDEVKNLDCLGVMKYYGLGYWLPEFEKWHKDATGNPLAEEVWRNVNENQNRITEAMTELSQAGVQTIVHGDIGLDNILFVEGEPDNEVFVIDWTQPHIGSVTEDLACLYDSAPDFVKSELIETYRKQIDFQDFDVIFAKAKMLRDIGYLCWMVWMINEGDKEENFQEDLDRVATSLVLSLKEDR